MLDKEVPGAAWEQGELLISPGIQLRRSLAVRGGGYFPVLLRLDNGELVAVVRGGAPHIGRAGRLDLIRSSDGGRTWSAPKTVIDSEEDDRNPAFGQLSGGTLVLAYATLSGYREDGKELTEDAGFEFFFTRSKDRGATWEKPHQLTICPTRHGSPFGVIRQMPDGTALLPFYCSQIIPGSAPEEVTSHPAGNAHILRSTDGGQSWGEPSLIGPGFGEPALLELGSGSLLAVLRSPGQVSLPFEGADPIQYYAWNDSALAVARSADGGRTWSKPEFLTKPGEHPANLLRLQSGNILLTYGNRNYPFGVRAVLSRDGGLSWDTEQTVILCDDSACADTGYPSSVQLDDGTIVTIYYAVGSPKLPSVKAHAACVFYHEEALFPSL